MADYAQSVAGAPDRLTLGNLDTGVILTVQYNPEKVTEELDIMYQRLAVVGQPHQPLQYTGTSNLKVSFDLAFDAAARTGGSRRDIMSDRNFLMAFAYPSRGARDIASGAPPRVLLMWPNLYSLTCKFTVYKCVFTSFFRDGTPNRLTASVAIEEVRDMRIWSEDVGITGTIRGAAVDR